MGGMVTHYCKYCDVTLFYDVPGAYNKRVHVDFEYVLDEPGDEGLAMVCRSCFDKATKCYICKKLRKGKDDRFYSSHFCAEGGVYVKKKQFFCFECLKKGVKEKCDEWVNEKASKLVVKDICTENTSREAEISKLSNDVFGVVLSFLPFYEAMRLRFVCKDWCQFFYSSEYGFFKDIRTEMVRFSWWLNREKGNNDLFSVRKVYNEFVKGLDDVTLNFDIGMIEAYQNLCRHSRFSGKMGKLETFGVEKSNYPLLKVDVTSISPEFLVFLLNFVPDEKNRLSQINFIASGEIDEVVTQLFIDKINDPKRIRVARLLNDQLLGFNDTLVNLRELWISGDLRQKNTDEIPNKISCYDIRNRLKEFEDVEVDSELYPNLEILHIEKIKSVKFSSPLKKLKEFYMWSKINVMIDYKRIFPNLEKFSIMFKQSYKFPSLLPQSIIELDLNQSKCPQFSKDTLPNLRFFRGKLELRKFFEHPNIEAFISALISPGGVYSTTMSWNKPLSASLPSIGKNTKLKELKLCYHKPSNFEDLEKFIKLIANSYVELKVFDLTLEKVDWTNSLSRMINRLKHLVYFGLRLRENKEMKFFDGTSGIFDDFKTKPSNLKYFKFVWNMIIEVKDSGALAYLLGLPVEHLIIHSQKFARGDSEEELKISSRELIQIVKKTDTLKVLDFRHGANYGAGTIQTFEDESILDEFERECPKLKMIKHFVIEKTNQVIGQESMAYNQNEETNQCVEKMIPKLWRRKSSKKS